MSTSLHMFDLNHVILMFVLHCFCDKLEIRTVVMTSSMSQLISVYEKRDYTY